MGNEIDKDLQLLFKGEKSFIEDFFNKVKALGTNVDVAECARAKEKAQLKEEKAKQEESSLFPFKEEKMFEFVKSWCCGSSFYNGEDYISPENHVFSEFRSKYGYTTKESVHWFDLRSDFRKGKKFQYDPPINVRQTKHLRENFNLPNLLRAYNNLQYDGGVDRYSNGVKENEGLINFWIIEFDKTINSNAFCVLGIVKKKFPNVFIYKIKGKPTFCMVISIEDRFYSIIVDSIYRALLVSKCFKPMKAIWIPEDKEGYLFDLFKCGKKVTTVSDIEETEEERKAINLRLARYAMKFWLNKK